MGYPKKHRGRRKMGSKKRRARKRNKKKQNLSGKNKPNQNPKYLDFYTTYCCFKSMSFYCCKLHFI